MELQEIKKALADSAHEVCQLLLPEGKPERNEWVGGRLASGEGGHSLHVVLSGEKAGVWKDFGGDVGGSNLLELWMQVKGTAFQIALAEVKEWLLVRGVLREQDLRPARSREYSKPSRAGITFMVDKVQMYLMAERLIPQPILELYKIAMTDKADAIVFPYLNEITQEAEMIKYLKLERDEKGKKQTWTSANTPKVLFGKHTRRPSDRYLLISEGEIDAMSWRSLEIPELTCSSVPFGAKWESEKTGQDPNCEWIENDWEYLNSFERIYLSLDMDEEGRKACASIIKRLGAERCFVIALPTKDANDMLKANRGEELKKCFADATTVDPERLKNSGHYRAAVMDRMFSGDQAMKRGIPLPFGNYPFHLRWNEWTEFTGVNSSGKSQLLGFLILYLWKLGHGSCVASLEVPVSKTLEFYVQQATAKGSPDRNEVDQAFNWFSTGIWFYDHVGQTNWRDLLQTWRYAYRRHGVRFFVLDSWMKLGIRQDDYDAQGEVCNAISTFVLDNDVHVFVVVHPRKVKSESDILDKMDVKGSGEITDQAHNVWLLWRNKPKERDLEQMVKMQESEGAILSKRKAKPDALLMVRKQRNDEGDEPTIDLWFQKSCKQFSGHYRIAADSFLPKPEPPNQQANPPAPEPLPDDVPF